MCVQCISFMNLMDLSILKKCQLYVRFSVDIHAPPPPKKNEEEENRNNTLKYFGLFLSTYIQ